MANKILTQNNDTFQEERKAYIGGSDISGIMGLSRWKTPLQVWAEKTGEIKSEDISDKICIKVGNELEDFVARLFCEETGKAVRRKNATIFHNKNSFIAANIDRRIVGENAILECKTASAYKAKEWKDEEIPEEYILQCLHYLAVMPNIEKCYIAVLVGNQSFHWKELTRSGNEEMLDLIIQTEVEFWNDFVIPKKMPAVSAQDEETLTKLYANVQDEEEIELDSGLNNIVEDIETLKQEKKKIDEGIKLRENQIKSFLKENIKGRTDKYKFAWKPFIRNSVDTKTLQTKFKDVYSEVLKQSEYKRFSYKAV
jgi:putative phage-type endonuclease